MANFGYTFVLGKIPLDKQIVLLSIKMTQNLQGKHVWSMYKDVCGEDMEVFCRLLEAFANTTPEHYEAVTWPIKRRGDSEGKVLEYIKQW